MSLEAKRPRLSLPLAPFEAPFEVQLANLVRTGRQFTEDPEGYKVRCPLPAYHMGWVKKNGIAIPERVQAVFDPFITIHGIDTLYVRVTDDEEKTLAERLVKYRRRSPVETTTSYVSRQLQQAGLKIGFSGFASGSDEKNIFSYPEEARGMQHVFTAFKQAGILVSLVVDGGTALGVPGLSGLIATQEGIETLGCIPIEGLKSIAPRNTTMIIGKTYGDETKMIGTLPDILIVLGGGPNAIKEYNAAIEAGNMIMILKLKEYPSTSLSSTFEDFPKTQEAKAKGQLRVCKDLNSLYMEITAITQEAIEAFYARRQNKKVALTGMY